MIKLEEFKKLGFNITWKLLDIGFKGSTYFSDELSTAEILDYAISKMDTSDDSDVIDLACEYADNVESIDKYLKKLAKIENSNYDIELRKWQVVYVSKAMPEPNSDFINALVELGDLWAKLGYPEDSPHVVQGRNNNISPAQYYTQENFTDLLNKNKEWVIKNIEQLRKL